MMKRKRRVTCSVDVNPLGDRVGPNCDALNLRFQIAIRELRGTQDVGVEGGRADIAAAAVTNLSH